MVNLTERDRALKISWLKILAENRNFAELVYSFLIPVMREDIWRCNLRKDHDLFVRETRDNFWPQVLKCWCEYNYSDNPLTNTHLIWLNSKLLVNGKPLWNENAYRKGLKTFGQLIKERRFISWKEAYDFFGLDIMQYNQLISAIPSRDKEALKADPQLTHSKYDLLLMEKSISRKVYNERIEDTGAVTRLAKDWSERLSSNITVPDMQSAFQHLYSITNVSRLRSFQYRMLHNSVVLNSHLYRWGILDSNLCTFCNTVKETLQHLFCDCVITRELWSGAMEWTKSKCSDAVVLNFKNIVFNRISSKVKSLNNFICLLLKNYIYVQRCKKQIPSVQAFLAFIRETEKIEKYNAIKNDMLIKHCNKWQITEECTVNEYIEMYGNS